MVGEETIKQIESLGRKLRRYRHIFMNQPIPSAIVGKNGIIIEVNKSLCQQIGLEKDKIEGKHFEYITHPEDIQNDLNHFTRLANKEIEHYRITKRYKNFKADSFFSAILNVWDMGDDLILGTFYIH